jgi:hypothetical protein
MRGSARFVPGLLCAIVLGASPATADPPAAPTAAPSPVAATQDAAEAAAIEALIVTVHVTSPARMRVDRRSTPTSPWVEVCWTPCDVRTWRDATYRVVGEGVMPSNPFSLPPARDGHVDLTVHPGSPTKRGVGIGMLIGGIVLAGVGGIVEGLGATGTSTIASGTREVNQNLLTAGTLILLAGVGVGVGGGSLVFGNMTSEVASAAAPRPEPSPTRGAAPAAPTGVALTLPILSASF